jgi:D-apionolactonase
VRRVRDRLGDAAVGTPVAGGTTLFFAEINRDPPECAAMDGLVFSINPQVHACDNTSLIENLESQEDVIRSAKALCDDLPVFISPITFIGRAGPYAAGPPGTDDLPGNVDVRQASLFGAGWTVGSLGRLAASGAAAVTYFETTGWLGLIERESGSPMPERFPSTPGMVFPLYEVLADIGEWKGAQVLELSTSDSLISTGLAVRDDAGVHVLAANLTDQRQTVRIGPLAGSQARFRVLDEDSAPTALADPARFRVGGALLDLRDGYARLTLMPFALVRLDPVGDQ